MKSGVEDRHLAHAWPTLARDADAGQCNGVVLRRQRSSLVDLVLDFRVHESRLAQEGATVCDTVADGIERRHAGTSYLLLDLVKRRGINCGMVDRRLDHGHGRCRVENPELEGRTAGVDG